MYSDNNLETMKRIFQTKVMMTVAVLLMAAVSGQQGLAAQDADESVLPDMGNVPDGVQEPGIGQADGKQGGVMQLRPSRGRWTWPAVSRWMRRWR